MKLYKDPNTNEIFAYEMDGSQDDLIKPEFVSITYSEADSIRSQKEVAMFDALSYQAKRASAYPPIVEYLDGIVKNDQQQIAKYIEDCLAVKAKYPKEQS